MKHRTVSALRRSSRVMRVATASVIASQLLMATPVFAQDAVKATVRATSRAAADLQRKLAKTRVRVNRTVPAVTRASLDATFGLNATTDAIQKARLFPERLVPTSPPRDDENRELVRVLDQWTASAPDDRARLIEDFVRDHPASPWRASLLANLAGLMSKEGYFSRAAAYWTQAWELARDSTDLDVRAIADFALGESLSQMETFGQVDRLDARLKEADGRDVRGRAGVKLSEAREGLAILRNHHQIALFSGPEALKALLAVVGHKDPATAVKTIDAYHPTVEGTSLVELRDLADRVGAPLQMWTATTPASFPVPSIVHLRSQHFSAIVGYRDGRYQMLDPALGGEWWASEEALRDESSGFALASARPSGSEWRAASAAEAHTVVGHCLPGKPSSLDPPCPNCGGGGPGSNGMPSYAFHPTTAALTIDDAPVGYTPAVGADMQFRLSYNHRETRQPATPGYGNVGSQWSLNWLGYMFDNVSMVMPPYTMKGVYLRGAGLEVYSPYDTMNVLSKAELVQVTSSPIKTSVGSRTARSRPTTSPTGRPRSPIGSFS